MNGRYQVHNLRLSETWIFFVTNTYSLIPQQNKPTLRMVARYGLISRSQKSQR